MSTILRTYKYLSLINRKGLLFPKQLKTFHTLFSTSNVYKWDNVLRSSSFHYRAYSAKAQEVESDSNFSTQPHSRNRISATQLDQLISKLDSDARRIGRLSQRDVERIFTLVKEIGNVSGTQSLLLIRGCGSFLSEVPKEERRRLVEDVWNTLLQQKCPLDVSHYNALLKVYLENEQEFDPIEFLSMMRKQEIHPNRVTYQRFVSHYCQIGDMDGASKILEFMKSKDLPMNELIFNDLIMGNVRGNNIEDGKNIIGVMRDAKLPISSSTYASLACGYATLGDISNVLATIQEAATEKVSLSDKEILNIIYTLTVSNHEHLVEQVLPHIQCKPGYSQECIITILELINKGFHKVAFSLLNTKPKVRSADGSAAPSGMFFIRQLVKQNVAPDVVIDYCKKMKTLGLNENALLKATEKALYFHKPDAAVAFIKELHSENYEVRSHFLWPVLASKRGNDKDLYDILKLMVDLNCPADDETFITHFFPYVPTSDPCSVISRLKDIGYEEKDIVQPLILFLLQNGDTRITAGFLDKQPVDITPLLTLSQAYIKSQDQESTVQILQNLDGIFRTKSDISQINNIYGEFLYHLAVSKSFTVPLLERLLSEMDKKDLKIDLSHTTLEIISNKLDSESRVQISNLLSKLTGSELPPSTLEKKLPERQVERLNSKPGLSRMLLIHAKQKNLPRVKEILKELDEQNFTYNGAHYASLIELYNFHGDLEKALYYKGVLDKEYPDFPIKEHTIINVASTLVQHNKIDDAENMLTTHYTKHGSQEEPSSLLKNILHLLNNLANSEEPERTKTFFEILLDFGYCNPEQVLLRTVIQAYLLNNNTSQAVEEFVRCVHTFKCTPSSFELFNHLILQEDTQNLQKATDAAISLHGEANVLLDLAISFIECGRIEQARKLIETPGLRVRMERVNNLCNYYVSRKKINEFETFIQMTKNVFGLNRDRMYYHLLKAYASEENVEKALSVWEMMQEEDVQPSDQTLHFLGTFLQKMNQPVPFAIPNLPRETSGKYPDRQVLVKEILEETNMKQALTENQRTKLKDNDLSVTDISKAMRMLLEKGNLQESLRLSENLFARDLYPNSDVSRLLAMRLSEAGDKESLLHLQERLPERIAKSIPFKDYLANAYIKSGQSDELLSSLENEVFKYKRNFPGGGLLALLAAKPETLDRVRKLVDVYYQEGSYLPRNMLWIYLMNNHKFEEAEQIFQTTPEMKSQLYFNSVLSTVKDKNDVEMSQKLLDQVKNSTLTKATKGLIYSTHIGVLIAIQKVDEALKTLKEMQSFMNIDDLSTATRSRLQKCLQNAGVSVPFVTPQSLEDTSSSSSDDEK